MAQKQSMSVHVSSQSQEWYTPEQYIEAARLTFGGTIDLDPASTYLANCTVKAHWYYTSLEDGLNKYWYGRIFCNPPRGRTGKYSTQALWFNKLKEEFESKRVSQGIIVLRFVPGYEWFENTNWIEHWVCITDHLISFVNPHNDNWKNNSEKVATMFLYMGSNYLKFADSFEQFGRIIPPQSLIDKTIIDKTLIKKIADNVRKI